ncbi:hypothetical protein RPMA_00575 [Tardiphaga alba]|uniref:Uncharacterized protein n=1 Tax=Tardiphaga alba TaxID=340268 RepID=A0ABX8A296_9BRAD|nr:hypothetical protein RPMA_00575 [Tardiphaga alba]
MKHRPFVFSSVMPGLVPGIYVFVVSDREGVDGRDKPGHDDVFPQRSKTRRAGSSRLSLTRTRKVTASLPSITR